METDIELLVKKYALQNAVKYGKAPQQGAVMGKLMGEHPELRQKAKEISPLIGTFLKDIASGTPEEWQAELEAVAPELIEELTQRKEPDKGLKELPDAESGVVMRFAPNPNGPPTLGSTRGIVVNSEYVKKYGGRFIIRFDDTDPVTKRPMPEAYDWYLEDCKWLGAEPDEVVMASDRLPVYYEYAEKLIKAGHAYVCTCTQEEFKKLKDNKQACPHRDLPPEHHLHEWERMLAGEYEERTVVLTRSARWCCVSRPISSTRIRRCGTGERSGWSGHRTPARKWVINMLSGRCWILRVQLRTTCWV